MKNTIAKKCDLDYIADRKEIVMAIESIYRLNEVELQNAKKWLTKHKKICTLGIVRDTFVCGGYISCIFSPNSIGTAVAIKCSCNNEECDITDYESW